MFSHAPCQKSATREAFLQGGGLIWGSRVSRALLGKMDTVKGAKTEQRDHFMRWCWFPHAPALLRATQQPSFPTHVPLHVHTHLTCRLGLTWAYKIRNQSPNQLGSPSISLLGNSVLHQDRKFPLSIFQQPLGQAIRNKSCHTHALVSFHTL